MCQDLLWAPTALRSRQQSVGEPGLAVVEQRPGWCVSAFSRQDALGGRSEGSQGGPGHSVDCPLVLPLHPLLPIPGKLCPVEHCALDQRHGERSCRSRRDPILVDDASQFRLCLSGLSYPMASVLPERQSRVQEDAQPPGLPRGELVELASHSDPINMSSSILSNLAKIQELKGRSNYQSWKSTMEGVLELEGLWDIVSGKRQRPEMQTDAKKYSVILKISAIYAYEQNGKAERMNKTLTDMAITTMIEPCLPEALWAEALRTPYHVRNRMVSRSPRSHKPTTSLEAYYGRKPEVQHEAIWMSRICHKAA